MCNIKMTHPGMAFVFVVGVGLATILYYMFSDSNNQQQQNNPHSNNNGTMGTGDLPNSWSVANGGRPRYRRKDSTTSDKASCTICLTEISLQQIVNVLPCGHPFHMKCIQDWRQQGQMEGHNCCPNCRRKIEELH